MTPAAAERVVGATESLTAAGAHLESIPARIPGWANVAAGTSADDVPTLTQSRAVRRRSAQLRYIFIFQHLVGEAHRRALVGMGTGLDLSTYSPTRPSAPALMTGIVASDRSDSAAVCSDQAVLSRKVCQIPVSRALPAGNETVNAQLVR